MKNMIIGAIILGVIGYGGSKLLLHHKIECSVDTAVMAISPFVNVEYDGVSSTMGGELTIDAIEARITDFNDTITIDRLGIDTPNYFSLPGLADIAEKTSAWQTIAHGSVYRANKSLLPSWTSSLMSAKSMASSLTNM